MGLGSGTFARAPLASIGDKLGCRGNAINRWVKGWSQKEVTRVTDEMIKELPQELNYDITRYVQARFMWGNVKLVVFLRKPVAAPSE